MAPLGDAMAKVLGATIPLGQLLLVRFGVQAVVLAPLVIATHRPWRMQARAVLPEPAKGSNTTPPLGVRVRRTNHSIRAKGFTVGWLLRSGFTPRL